ncbi:MAG TPA: 2Fe-2S iron-sulfur cluster binding domain-containing protein [Polyangiaceae bacterium]|nr:2Fe-2S iron-sulfur cluster binding domain-containing protein [Polyangiaceae bacterium]
MGKVTFKAMGKTWETEVEVGKSILELARRAHAPEGDACGGVCACSTCHVYVEKGEDLLSDAEEDEEDILDKAFDVRMESRLGCQAKVQQAGDLVVSITRESLDAFYNEHPDEADPRKAG